MQNAMFDKKQSTVYQHKHLIPSVKHGAGDHLSLFCSHRTCGHLTFIELTTNVSVYQSNIELNVGPFAQQL